MKLWGMLLCIAMMVGSPPIPAQARQAASIWRDTGLDFGFVEERVNARACYESQVTFLSCIAAIQRVLDLHGRHLRLVALTNLPTDHGPVQMHRQFSRVAVVADPEQRLIDPGNASSLLRERSRRILKWRGQYSQDAGDRIDFTALRNWLLAEVVDATRVEDFAAAAINGYLGISDAHAKIVPAASLRGNPPFRKEWRRSGRAGTVDHSGISNTRATSFVDRGREFAYLRIDSFTSGGTCAEARREIGWLLKPSLDGLILDLRNNAGGLIDQAVCVADLFLPSGKLVLAMRDVDEQGHTRSIRTRYRQLTGVPLVTLVNPTTGSASEVLAGALQDHKRSFVVGERTFGKGTVQTARPWNGSDSILEFYTAARYYRPSGIGVQLVGIQPDLEVSEQPDPMANRRVVLREGDLFATALPPEPVPWKQPRKERVAAISACVTDEGLARARWKRGRKDGPVSDYPVYFARDTLTCMLQQRIY